MKLTLLILLVAFQATAGERGNGGDAVVCPDGVVLLDFHEMKRHKRELYLPGASLSEKVMNVIKKIKQLDPYRGAQIEKFAPELIIDVEKFSAKENEFEHINFTTEILSDISDSHEVSIPRNCRKEQLVYQNTPVFDTDRRYVIAEPLWIQMNEDQHVLTILHELWYRVLDTEGIKDSRYVRYINGYFASTEVKNPNFRDYIVQLTYAKRLSGVELTYMHQVKDSFPVKIWDAPLAYDFDSKKLKKIEDLTVDFDLELGNKRDKEDVLVMKSPFEVNENLHVVVDRVQFSPNGKVLRTIGFVDTDRFIDDRYARVKYRDYDFIFKLNNYFRVEFDGNGDLVRLSIAGIIKVKEGTKTVLGAKGPGKECLDVIFEKDSAQVTPVSCKDLRQWSFPKKAKAAKKPLPESNFRTF